MFLYGTRDLFDFDHFKLKCLGNFHHQDGSEKHLSIAHSAGNSSARHLLDDERYLVSEQAPF